VRQALEGDEAHTFSQRRTAADELGSRPSAASMRSSSLKSPPTSMPSLSSASWTSGSSSVSSIATALPSSSLPTKAMSMIRIVPESTRSPMAGAISPRNRLPGNATIA
jgi:hypothetical protein